MQTIKNIRDTFAKKYLENDFVTDKTGVKTIEILNASFLCDEEIIFGNQNYEWINRELQWYLSESLNVNDIPPPVPLIWKQVADPQGFINSNYGYCVFSEENGNQYLHVKNELSKNIDSRRGLVIYTRPQMHIDYNKNGRSDFMCATTSHFLIRNNKLINIMHFRSQDSLFGFKGDYAWVKYVYDKMYSDLKLVHSQLEKTPIQWNANSLHVYERHFEFVKDYLKNDLGITL